MYCKKPSSVSISFRQALLCIEIVKYHWLWEIRSILRPTNQTLVAIKVNLSLCKNSLKGCTLILQKIMSMDGSWSRLVSLDVALEPWLLWHNVTVSTIKISHFRIPFLKGTFPLIDSLRLLKPVSSTTSKTQICSLSSPFTVLFVGLELEGWERERQKRFAM